MEQRRILIVEDEILVSRAMQMILTRHGAEVRVAGSAETALSLAPQFRPEIVLCDLHLKGAYGFDLIDKFLVLLPKTTCIVVSGDTNPRVAKDAFNRNLAFLRKPFSVQELLDCLQGDGVLPSAALS